MLRGCGCGADDPEAEAVAWLHDVLEDFGFPMRWATDFPRDTRDSVIRLTRTKRESSADYYALIATDPVALRVKLADIADNANESRLALLDDKTATRLRRKYAKAIAALTGAAGGGSDDRLPAQRPRRHQQDRPVQVQDLPACAAGPVPSPSNVKTLLIR